MFIVCSNKSKFDFDLEWSICRQGFDDPNIFDPVNNDEDPPDRIKQRNQSSNRRRKQGQSTYDVLCQNLKRQQEQIRRR